MTDTTLPAPLIIRAVLPGDEQALRRLWNLFRHEMSQHTPALPDSDGLFRKERLEHALAGKPGWAAWIVTAGSSPVGFALARGLDTPEHVLTSFFLVHAARRVGLGRRLAETVFTAYPGRWAIAYQDANLPAAQFWPAIAEAMDPAWTQLRRDVQGRPDLPPDCWIILTAGHS